jgi:inner membrane protein
MQCIMNYMTGRTHDLAAFAALSYVISQQPIHSITLATAFVVLGANMIGGLTPDIDQPTGDLWNRIPAGSLFGKILAPLLGGHRYISHSVLGVVLFGFLLSLFLTKIKTILLVDMNIVWFAFMIGYISHLFMDLFTYEGVPILFPIPIKIGFPPFKILRIKTGGFIEKSVIFPLLLVVTGSIYYFNYSKFWDFFRHLIK